MASSHTHCVCLGISTLFLLLFGQTEAKWTEGTIIDEDADWVFLTRFCFLSKVGKMQYKLEYPKDFSVENLLFYYDVPGQWDAVYKRGLNCTQQVAALKGNNIFRLDSGSLRCQTETRDSRDWYVCSGNMDFSSARERWWYVTISRCGPPQSSQVKGLHLYYKLHMTNGDDLLHEEFSADEFYILLTDIIFFILYIKIMVLSIICAVILTKRQLLHTTYKLYLVAVTLWTVHLFCMVVAWGSYGTTGWEMRRMEVLGRIIAAGSNVVFILLLILLAKGYTIVRGRLTNKAMVKITSFIFLYIVCSVALFIWEGVLFDPGLVLYYYESPPGYCLVAIILLGWLWFTKAAVFTLKHFTAKTNFYIMFYTIYTIWFWASPIIILIAMFSMAKWTREKTVNGVQQCVAYLGHVIFLVLTMPSKVNTNFPYHIKTSQIGSMPETDDLTGADSFRTGEDSDSRGRQTPGAYTLSHGDSSSGTGPNLEMFMTTKAGSRGAGYEADGQMYGPLDLSMLRVKDDSPPPAYSQATAESGTPSAPHPDTSFDSSGDSSQQHLHREDPNPQETLSGGDFLSGDNVSINNNNSDGSENSHTKKKKKKNKNKNTNSSGMHLPPLQQLPEEGHQHGEAERSLPPIRSRLPALEASTLPPLEHSRLPPLEPSAPPSYEEYGGGHGPSDPPAYADMFRVGKD